MRRCFLSLAAFVVLSFPALAAEENAQAVARAFTHLVEGEFTEAKTIVAPLADAGDPEAQHLLGYLFENGLGVDVDVQRAVDLYLTSARAGQADAQYSLGELALAGEAVQRDPEIAVGWYKLAARQGHGKAMLRLGVLHAQGDGVEKDMPAALTFFEEAAEEGVAEAARNVAIAYLTGDGVARNYRTAATWFEKAADGDDPVANYNLGLLHQSGRVGAPDMGKSEQHMRASAQAGFGPAMTALGLILHETGKPDDDEHPADWFARAAGAGDPQGRFLYAVALSEGDGRDVDFETARALLDSVLGDANASAALKGDAEKLKRRLKGRR